VIDANERDAVIESLLPLVRHVVSRMGVFMPSYLSPDDLISAGVMGLIQAVDRYDSTKGATLKTYCAIRVRGAVLDEVRRLADVPRSAFVEARRLLEVQQELAQQLGREATEPELQEALGMTSSEFETLLERIRPTTCFSLNEPVHEGQDGGEMLLNEEILADPRALDAAESSLNQEDLSLVRELLDQLPEQQKKVLALYYIEDLRLREIAELLGVTEGRVSQVHALAINRLRIALERKHR
jgi:RNA polymerase sigma factor for flagellar operon FliA